MPSRDEYKKGAAVKSAPAKAALAERWLRPADQLDRMIRRWVIPVGEDSIGVIAPTSSQLSRPRTASTQITAALNEIQLAIGRGLRAEYDLAQPIPARVLDLLTQLEHRVVTPEGFPGTPSRRLGQV
jgi:hypothetical protein